MGHLDVCGRGTTSYSPYSAPTVVWYFLSSPSIWYVDGHPVAAFMCNAAMVPVDVNLVFVDRREVAVIVGVEAAPRVVVHLVPPPVSLLVAVCVDPEICDVNVGVIDIIVDVDIVEKLGITLIVVEPADLIGCDRRRSTTGAKTKNGVSRYLEVSEAACFDMRYY